MGWLGVGGLLNEGPIPLLLILSSNIVFWTHDPCGIFSFFKVKSGG